MALKKLDICEKQMKSVHMCFLLKKGSTRLLKLNIDGADVFAKCKGCFKGKSIAEFAFEFLVSFSP